MEQLKSIIIVDSHDGLYLAHKSWIHKLNNMEYIWYLSKPGGKTHLEHYKINSVSVPFRAPLPSDTDKVIKTIIVDDIRYHVKWDRYPIRKIYDSFGKY